MKTPSPMEEGQVLDKKSLRLVEGKSTDFNELAKDCVSFANGSGGTILIGIEDGEEAPPSGQRISPALADQVGKRSVQLVVNVAVSAESKLFNPDSEIIELVIARSSALASTKDGRYFVRVGDSCQPIVGDDIMRLANERPLAPWETSTSLRIPRTVVDRSQLSKLLERIRSWKNVKSSVREKSDFELINHLGLADGDFLTNLGVLMVGTATDRAKLGTAPIVQAIVYDDRPEKINQTSWN